MKEEVMKLIEDNKNLIYKIASNYSTYYDIEDLFQVGVIGLLDAKKHYKDENVKFSSFAYKYILGQIIEYIKKDRNIIVNSTNLKIYKLYEKAKDFLTQKYLKEPSFNEICSYLNIDQSLVYEAINNALFTSSLDNEEYYYNMSSDNNNVDDKIMINDEIEKLNNFDKSILECRYYKDYSQQETASYLGVSQVKISRYEKKILQKMRNNITMY